MKEEGHFTVLFVPADETQPIQEHLIKRTYRFYDEVADFLQIERIRWDYLEKKRNKFTGPQFVSDKCGLTNKKKHNTRANRVLFGCELPEQFNNRIYGDAVLLTSYYVDSDDKLNRDGYQEFRDVDLKCWESINSANKTEYANTLDQLSEQVFIKDFILFYEPNYHSMKLPIGNLFESLPEYYKLEEWKPTQLPKSLLFILCQKVKKNSVPRFEKEFVCLTHPPSFLISVVLPFPPRFDYQIEGEKNKQEESQPNDNCNNINKNEWKIIPTRKYSTMKDAEHNASLIAFYEIFRIFSHFIANKITLQSLFDPSNVNSINNNDKDKAKEIKENKSKKKKIINNFDCSNNSNVVYDIQNSDSIQLEDNGDDNKTEISEENEITALIAKFSELIISNTIKETYESVVIAEKGGLVKKYIIENGTGELPRMRALTTGLF